MRCQICGKELSIINHLHLRTHDVTTEEYKEMFPDSRIISKEHSKKRSEIVTGKKNPFYGKTHSEEFKEEQSERAKRRFGERFSSRPKEWKKHISEALTGKPKPWMEGKKNHKWKELDEETMIELYREGWSSRSLARKFGANPTTITRRLRKRGVEIRSKISGQTGIEKELEEILKNLNHSLEYVGDGKMWIDGKCPDFIDKEERKIIELFSNFHDPKHFDVPYHQTEEGTRNFYEERGFDILIIWDEELEDRTKIASRVNDLYE